MLSRILLSSYPEPCYIRDQIHPPCPRYLSLFMTISETSENAKTFIVQIGHCYLGIQYRFLFVLLDLQYVERVWWVLLFHLGLPHPKERLLAWPCELLLSDLYLIVP